MWGFIGAALVVAAASFWQSFGWLLWGVNPNLVLVSLITTSFFLRERWSFLFLAALAGLILKFSPSGREELIIIFLLGIGLAVLKNYLPWNNLLGVLVLIFLGTLIFYLFFGPRLIFSVVFGKEIFLNLALGLLFFALLGGVWQNKK